MLQDTKASADTDEARRNRAVLSDKVRKEGASAVADAFMPKLLGKTTQGEQPALVERVREAILRTSPQGMIDALAGLAARADSTRLAAPDPRPDARGLRRRGHDHCPSRIRRALHRGIAGSRLVVIPKAGHLSNLEKPAAYNEALTAFLGKL